MQSTLLLLPVAFVCMQILLHMCLNCSGTCDSHLILKKNKLRNVIQGSELVLGKCGGMLFNITSVYTIYSLMCTGFIKCLASVTASTKNQTCVVFVPYKKRKERYLCIHDIFDWSWGFDGMYMYQVPYWNTMNCNAANRWKSEGKISHVNLVEVDNTCQSELDKIISIKR